MIHVDEFNLVEQLHELRSTWRDLLEQTPQANFFQTLDWLEVYWQYWGHQQRLRVLLVSDGGQPVGLLPLVVRSESTRVGNLRFVTYPLDYWGSFYGPLGSAPAKTLEAGLHHLRRTRRDWDLIELRWAGSPLAALTRDAMRASGMTPVLQPHDQTAVVDLEGSWETYLASRKGKWRNNLRRWERKLAEAGQVRYERFRPSPQQPTDPDPRWDLYETCLRIAAESWQGSSRTGTTLTHETVRPFLRAAHAAAVRCGAADINLLYVNEQPVAFAYNYVLQGYVYGLRIGFDQAFTTLGPGNILYVRALQDSFQRGDRFYDLGPGSLEAKRHLLTDLRPLYRCGHFPYWPVRARLLGAKRWWDSRRAPLASVPSDGDTGQAG